MEEIQNINIREEYYKEVYDLNPKWWMRWGIMIVVIIMLLIVTMGSIIKYPDTINSECRLTTNTPSITIPILQSAQIEKIFIDSNDQLTSNTPILVLKNNSNYEDVFFLENALEKFSFEKDSIINFFNRFIETDLILGGNIENNWIALSNELLEYYKIEELDSYQSQIQFTNSELSKQINLKKYYQGLIKHDGNQKELLDQKIKSDSVLYSKGVISRMEYNKNQREHLNRVNSLENNVLALKRINLDIVKLRNSIQNHGNNEKGFLLEKQLAIRKSLSKLKSSISLWKKRYLITSPTDGKVTFVQNLKEGSYYEGNILVVTPPDKNFYAIVNIPFVGAGKVEEGQKVNLKLNDYPFREYGILEGTLTEFSPVAGESYYLGKVEITKGITSSYGKKIKVKENMTGIGEIITNDRSILGRLFEKITYAFSR